MMSGKIFTVENVSLKTMPLVKHSAHTVAHSTPFYDAAVDKEPALKRHTHVLPNCLGDAAVDKLCHSASKSPLVVIWVDK